MRLLLCMILYLVGVIQAAPTTNATTTSYGFEDPSFTNRTLWSIISSSVLTLFACTYTAIHPNIPSPKDSLVRILWRRLGIMIMALIVPELIVTWAMRQRLSARYVTTKFKESGYFNDSQLQAQYENHELAEVHAERLQDHDRARLLVAPAKASNSQYRGIHALAHPFKKLSEAYHSEESEDYAWTQTHSFFVLMGGFMLYVDGEPYHTLEPDQVLQLIREGRIDAPIITEKQIQDKSKGNVISKGLIMLQVAWFILQLISRAIYHLETTQLEAGTLAFAVLNFLTYALWWNKPLDVQCPHPVYWNSTESYPEDHIDDVSTEDDENMYEIVAEMFRPFMELMSFPGLPTPNLRVPTFDGSIEVKGFDKWIILFAGILMATIFGGIHCMAWFFAFPTSYEQDRWRMSVIAIVCIPWLELLLKFVADNIHSETLSGIFVLVMSIFGAVYITARGMLLGIMFSTLRNLPPDAYMAVSWISFVPHL